MNARECPVHGADGSGTKFDYIGVDTLYDYRSFLSEGPVAEPGSLLNHKVAVVGAGVAGLCAAYELLRIGARPIVFESGDRIGGRAWTKSFQNADGTPSSTMAEMGAMRFPKTSQVMMHYVRDVFDLPINEKFPNPGQVPTLLSYCGQTWDWTNGDRTLPPGPFQRIAKDWHQFINSIVEVSDDLRRKQDEDGLRQYWQYLVNKYQYHNFYSALRSGITHWTEDDINLFGALGFGTGGFSALFQSSFLEILRVAVNHYEDDQCYLVEGVSSLAEAYYRRPIPERSGNTSLEALDLVKLNHRVEGLYRRGDGTVTLRIGRDDGSSDVEQFDAAILTITGRALQMLGRSPASSSRTTYRPSATSRLQNIHMVESSKLFIRTKDKFWLRDDSLPQTILMDELARAVYCLDYPNTDEGVVLMSYVWGSDSTKIQALPPKVRFDIIRAQLWEINPKFTEHLVPLNDEILCVDWQAEKDFHGAFKIIYPGQDGANADVYYDFLKSGSDEDDGVYLAGDSVSWAGGWIEGALQTAINAVCAVTRRMGGEVRPDSPLSQRQLYDFSDRPNAGLDQSGVSQSEDYLRAVG